jgi:hypothetical protein
MHPLIGRERNTLCHRWMPMALCGDGTIVTRRVIDSLVNIDHIPKEIMRYYLRIGTLPDLNQDSCPPNTDKHLPTCRDTS